MKLDKLVTKYSEVLSQKKELENQLSELKGEIEKSLPDDGFSSKVGTFSWGVRKSYTYPANVKELEGRLKDAKAKAEKSGKATLSETTYSRFTPPKK